MMRSFVVILMLLAGGAQAEPTKVAIFYSLATGEPRWTVLPENDAQLEAMLPARDEGKLVVPKTAVRWIYHHGRLLPDVNSLRAIVLRNHGS